MDIDIIAAAFSIITGIDRAPMPMPMPMPVTAQMTGNGGADGQPKRDICRPCCC
jgi:hypothetical protein